MGRAKRIADVRRVLFETGAPQVVVAQGFGPQRGVPVGLHRQVNGDGTRRRDRIVSAA